MLDLLWDVFSSAWTLAIGGGISAAVLVGCLIFLGPAVVLPALGRALGAIARCKPCLFVLAIGAAFYAGVLVASQVESSRCEERLAAQRTAAAEAAKERDAGVKADLEKTYRPKLRELERLAGRLKSERDRYAKHSVPAGACKLGRDSLRLRALTAREPSGTAADAIARYLRRDPGRPGSAAGRPG